MWLRFEERLNQADDVGGYPEGQIFIALSLARPFFLTVKSNFSHRCLHFSVQTSAPSLILGSQVESHCRR